MKKSHLMYPRGTCFNDYAHLMDYYAFMLSSFCFSQVKHPPDKSTFTSKCLTSQSTKPYSDLIYWPKKVRTKSSRHCPDTYALSFYFPLIISYTFSYTIYIHSTFAHSLRTPVEKTTKAASIKEERRKRNHEQKENKRTAKKRKIFTLSSYFLKN